MDLWWSPWATRIAALRRPRLMRDSIFLWDCGSERSGGEKPPRETMPLRISSRASWRIQLADENPAAGC
jgi:hypothetical protein